MVGGEGRGEETGNAAEDGVEVGTGGGGRAGGEVEGAGGTGNADGNGEGVEEEAAGRVGEAGEIGGVLGEGGGRLGGEVGRRNLRSAHCLHRGGPLHVLVLPEPVGPSDVLPLPRRLAIHDADERETSFPVLNSVDGILWVG